MVGGGGTWLRSEIDAPTAYGLVAEDADTRAASGWKIVSISSLPLRPGGTFLGRDGSGLETKISVSVVYATN
jgi:hypothetical protein